MDRAPRGARRIAPPMRALRLLRQAAALEEQLVADPVPGPGEVLVGVRYAGICHSDAHYRADGSRVRLPLTLGHEIAGVVVAAGQMPDRKSTRLNSSHGYISYAVFCLK